MFIFQLLAKLFGYNKSTCTRKAWIALSDAESCQVQMYILRFRCCLDLSCDTISILAKISIYHYQVIRETLRWILDFLIASITTRNCGSSNPLLPKRVGWTRRGTNILVEVPFRVTLKVLVLPILCRMEDRMIDWKVGGRRNL